MGAEQGTIAIMVGSMVGQFEQSNRRSNISPNVFHAGGAGAGADHVRKLANNMFSLLFTAAASLESGRRFELHQEVIRHRSHGNHGGNSSVPGQ